MDKVKIKLGDNAILPTKGTPGAAAYDIAIPEDTLVMQGRQAVNIKLSMEIVQGYEAKVEARSGLSLAGMEGYAAANAENATRYNCDVIPGKIDADYRGEIHVILHNNDLPFYLRRSMKIAQLTFYKVESAEWELAESLSETERADGKFGHTGV